MTPVRAMALERSSDATNTLNLSFGSHQAFFDNLSCTAFSNQSHQWTSTFSSVTEICPTKFVSDIIFSNNHTFQFWCLRTPPDYDLLRFALSAVQFIWSKTPVFAANQERGRFFYFSTADWSTSWRAPSAVQTMSMSEQVTKLVANAAFPVPPSSCVGIQQVFQLTSPAPA
jgi:hypothetical protein